MIATMCDCDWEPCEGYAHDDACEICMGTMCQRHCAEL